MQNWQREAWKKAGQANRSHTEEAKTGVVFHVQLIESWKINCLHGCWENVQLDYKKTVPQETSASYGTVK